MRLAPEAALLGWVNDSTFFWAGVDTLGALLLCLRPNKEMG
jgi:hypothetical protein